MTTSNPIPQSLDPGTARKREDAAKAPRAKYQATPEVRSQLAAILEERDAIRDQQTVDSKAAQQARPDAVRAILQHASVDELSEFQRVAGQLDGRRLADIVADVIRQRQRTGYVPVIQEAQEAVPALEASETRRTRRSPS